MIQKKQSEIYSWELHCTYYVEQQLSIQSSTTTVKPGDTFTLTANESSITWVCDNPAITIDANGNATVNATATNGTANIYATKDTRRSNTITITIANQ